MGNSISKAAGLRIAKLREARGLSQAELAKELEKIGLKVKRETITQWENGTRDLKTEYTVKLAEFFDVSCDEILRGIKAENIPISKSLGLSDRTVTNLRQLFKDQPALSAPINDLLSNQAIATVSATLGIYLDMRKEFLRLYGSLLDDCYKRGLKIESIGEEYFDLVRMRGQIYELNDEQINDKYKELLTVLKNADAYSYRILLAFRSFFMIHDGLLLEDMVKEEKADG